VGAGAAVAAVVLAAGGYAGRLLWRLLRGTWGIIQDWQAMKDAIADVRAEMKLNDGASMRDAVQRIEQDVAAVKAEQVLVRKQLATRQHDEGKGA